MSERDAFLRAIAESPDDDAPRLVFADWLDEQGEPARAELIRLQCEVDTLPEGARHNQLVDRSDALLAGHGATWEAGLPAGQREYRRGFLDVVQVRDTDVVAALPALAAIRPAVCIQIDGLRTATAAAMADVPELADVRRLWLKQPFNRPDESWEALLRSPHLSRLTGLDLSPNSHDFTTDFASREWTCLEHLRHFGCGWGFNLADLRNLFTPPNLSAIRTLRILLPHPASDSITVLTSWPGLAQVEALLLYSATDEALRTLAESGRAGQLRRLTVRSQLFTPAGCLATLAAHGLPALGDVTFRGYSPDWPPPPDDWSIPAEAGLRSVTMSNVPLDDAAVAELAALPRLASLHALQLPGCGITAAGVRALATSPLLGELRTLGLANNRLGTTGVDALARSPHLSRLELLDLKATEPGLRGIRALSRAVWTRSLIELDLSNNVLTNEVSHALAAIPFESLRTLRVMNAGLTWVALAGADWLSRLEKLAISLGVTDADAVRLARRLGPGLRTLTALSCDFGLPGLRALLATDLPRLRTLDLSGTPIGTPGVRALAGWPGLATLSSLGLFRCGVCTVGIRALAASPHLSRACTVRVRGQGVEATALAALRERVNTLLIV